ncbi:hypothetical protein WG78_07465 [Amantichitinum ursilacus]|uniref:Uncharacterized protein n=1 Tax=Amantichitinum ursilacus TaxID=857265 RepID=A0A0N0GPF6_9NEIS|nr:hypothetical protein WG78_07465 [Amantichitinum ursilacus]
MLAPLNTPLWPNTSLPSLTLTAPALVARLSVVMPLPFWLSVPVPVSAPDNTTASLRLIVSVPALTISPATAPVVPPAPSCSVPLLMVVTPVAVLLPVSVSTALPDLVNAPVPAITPSNEPSTSAESVSVPEPSSTLPPPDRLCTLCALLVRSSVPPDATCTLPLLASASTTPNASVPPATVVAPV